MDKVRRTFIQTLASLGAGVLAARKAEGAQHEQHLQHDKKHKAEGKAPSLNSKPGIIAVETPDVPKLPYQIENGVKVFHLVAEPVRRNLLPFKAMDVWGYSGSCPGPTIQVNEGDHVRIVFENRLPESTTVHWHGLEVPIKMDGVPYISQPPVPPGGSYTYEFTLNQNGTYFYHSHSAMQEMMGMIGMFVIHPRTPYKPRVDHDFEIGRAHV